MMQPFMQITSNFDGGNIDVLSCDEATNIRLEILPDNESEFFQWFYKKHNSLEEAFLKNRKKDLPTILLNSHHDTVKPVAGWRRNPFDPVVENGKLYGLGSNDAGGALVALATAFVHFYKQKNLPFNLVFLASAEEEISGKHGVASVLDKLGKIDFGIVGEPTQMQMAVAEKGLIVIDGVAQRLNSSGIPVNHPIVKVGHALGLSVFGSATLSDQALMPFPTLKIGPGNSSRSHTADEFIRVKEINDGIDIYCQLLNGLINFYKKHQHEI